MRTISTIHTAETLYASLHSHSAAISDIQARIATLKATLADCEANYTEIVQKEPGLRPLVETHIAHLFNTGLIDSKSIKTSTATPTFHQDSRRNDNLPRSEIRVTAPPPLAHPPAAKPNEAPVVALGPATFAKPAATAAKPPGPPPAAKPSPAAAPEPETQPANFSRPYSAAEMELLSDINNTHKLTAKSAPAPAPKHTQIFVIGRDELTAITIVNVNGEDCTWASFLKNHDLNPADIRAIHDELMQYGETIFSGGALPESEIRLAGFRRSA